MKKNEKIKDFYLINLLKFRNNNCHQPINIEKEYKHKDNIILNQLTYLSNISLYFQELDRLKKLNNENLMKQNKKIVHKKKSNREYFDKIKKIVKGSSNKMLLDIIYNNHHIKNKLFSFDNKRTKNNKYKIKLKDSPNNLDTLTNFKFKKCHTDSVNLLSNKNSYKNFTHSLSFSSHKNHTLFLKRKNNFFSSKELLKTKTDKNDKTEENYDFKGMLKINYNYKDKLNKIKRNYSKYRYENKIK